MQGGYANDAGVVAWRRSLHAFPELGFLEFRTASLVAAHLHTLGYAVKAGPEVMRAEAILAPPAAEAVAQARHAALTAGAPPEWVARLAGGQTGVVAEWRRGDGPVLAFRFDMDALPVPETDDPAHRPNRDGYRSRNSGVMHACGHDGHTAIGLALAERLAQPAAGWRGTVRLIFQPAEEGGRGALPMVEAGVLDGVDWWFAGHLGCHLPSRRIAAQATGFLFSRKLDVRLRGRATHAAMAPQDGRNALLAAATATLGLHALARHAREITHVNVGRLVAGTGRNVIADSAELLTEVRGETEAGLAMMESRARQVLAGAAQMQDVAMEIRDVGGTIGAEMSQPAVDIVATSARTLADVEQVLPGWPIGGGDDATYMLRQVQRQGGQGAYFILGCDIPAAHHASDFDIDEAALDQGVRLFERITATVLGAG